MDSSVFTRRSFLKVGSGALLAGAAARVTLLDPAPLFAAQAEGGAKPIRFGLIGAGVRGCQLLQASLNLPGVECVAVSDLYDGRRQAAQEYAGKPLQATRSFHELLDRKDLDAVIVATMDHQHARVVTAALAAGKDVYCEKPMSHTVEQGFEMVAAAEKSNRILQIGSQRVSNILYAKAREIFASGALGQVYAVEAYTDRNSAGGAWAYPVPPSANEQTIDWDEFLVGAPKVPYDALRFFRWRGYRDYGEGLPGDLYVHLLSGIQFVTGINTIPARAYSSGGLYHWKWEGRDQPDVLETLYEYPSLHVLIRCDSNSNAGEMTAFYGTKGTLEIRGPQMTVTSYPEAAAPEMYSTIGWSAQDRNAYLAQWHAEHPEAPIGDAKVEQHVEVYSVPAHYDETLDHEAHFFEAVRTRKAPVEDGVFGNHTAIACHMANASYFQKGMAEWDEGGRRIRV